MSKNYSVQLGRNWHWRVDDVEAADMPLRLLTAYHPDIEEFRAWLAMPRGEAAVMIARLEFHGSHPGWHCHAACCDVADIDAGQCGPREGMRLPHGLNVHRRIACTMTESSALSTAFEFFRVTGAPEGSIV